MENITTTSNILDDIIEKSAEQTGTIFHTYKAQSVIGAQIFKELYSKLVIKKDKKQDKIVGFAMDDSKQVGILSQCQCLQALMQLTSEYHLGFDDAKILKKGNYTVRQIMDAVIDDVLDRIKTETPGKYCFDASPYETELFDTDYSNIEAMTWVVPSFLLTLKYHADNGETCRWQDELVDVITYCLKYINAAFIDKNEGETDALTIGWNFTKECDEPSLYYTFTVCECFLDFFNTFEEYLEYRSALRNEKAGIPMDAETSAKYEAHMKDFEESTKIGRREKDPVKDAHKYLLAQHSPFNEMRMRYQEINEGRQGIDSTLYGELESKCLRVAREVWRLTRDDLADAFFYNDLHTRISEQDINIATTSDALFNTVYIINILLDAGLDEEFQRNAQIAQMQLNQGRLNDSKGRKYADVIEENNRAYNNLLESCQMALQKAFRTYDKLKIDGKEYIVDQFLVGFNETFTTHRAMITELRKRRMRVFSLMPLLIHTNSVISEYLIKYPQLNMQKYLGYILENRYQPADSNTSRWIWEKDGYFSCSNYYYIAALAEFYRYYEKFESKFISNYVDNEANRKRIETETEAKMKLPGGELDKQDKDIQRLEKRNKKLSDEIKELRAYMPPIETAVKEVTAENIRALFPEMLSTFLCEAADDLTASALNQTAPQKASSDLMGALGKLMIAAVGQNIYEQVLKDADLSDAEKEEKFNEYTRHVEDNFAKIIADYITAIKNNSNNITSVPFT
ncbi:MAG: hypothetical protein IKU51_01210 [Clostridia bacterium]|nr:hypothetical protein [Clostridia bacterium]